MAALARLDGGIDHNTQPAGQGRLRPPLACSECRVGSSTVYGVTHGAAPDKLSALRREINIVEANRIILRQDEVPKFFFTLYSGWAFRYVQLPDGRRQILSFLLPGDSMSYESVYFPGCPLPFAVRSVTQVALCSFDVSAMRDLLDKSDAQRRELNRALHDYVTAMHRRLTDLGRRRATGRMAQLLLELDTRLDDKGLVEDGGFLFPLRQEHIADALGLTPVHVSRTMAALKGHGVIAMERERLRILDRDALRTIAEED